jgi:ABC-type uncharacterized transport system permease subunit
MKIVNGIISVVLGGLALYLMFTAKTNLDLTFMFITLLMAVVFLCFVIIEEQKEEVNDLKRLIYKIK